ncbi:MAG: 3' terminal RNA ribose 2'-O-methyltransferase Hen1, partial [Deltaproteobacteria bacterium]|nr:3' terminal RNA ribose 2'-O-methyltransferase Hen1 [Deltaproteobacteria bacterium]
PDRLPEGAKDRLQLFQASLAYADDRFAEYEALALVEVLEHLDPWRLDAMAQAIFREARPATVVLSTPNREYNQAFGRPRPSGLRHADHRFEFTRQEFRDWAGKVAGDHGYRVDCQEIGVPAEGLGAPSLMGVFQRCG